jgi:hypothetical protein
MARAVSMFVLVVLSAAGRGSCVFGVRRRGPFVLVRRRFLALMA